ncbi:MAG: hypothetical protein HYX97_04190 [Chloroflexi bacterium]|nr:hypothetical protein [Chloroflexota bacterium]
MSATLDAGQSAPGFMLPSTQGPIVLGDLLHHWRVVLAFYTEDLTPT